MDDADIQSLTATVQRLADKDEIRELIAAYSFCIDTNRSRELLDLFTDDCVVSYGGGVTITGKDDFRARRERSRGMSAASHHNADVRITFDGPDSAQGVVSLYAWQIIAERDVTVWGYYFDEYRRVDGYWRFAVRRLQLCGHDGYTAPWDPVERAPGNGL